MGFSVSIQSLFYKKYLDYKHIGFIFVIYSLMVFDEHKVNTKFWCTHSRRSRENVDGLCKTVAVAHSVMTCHCKAYPKTNYPGRHIILSFWQMKNGGHNCERSLMVTLSWVVVIHHTKIFVFFGHTHLCFVSNLGQFLEIIDVFFLYNFFIVFYVVNETTWFGFSCR